MLIANLAPRDVGKVAVDMALSTISFSGLLVVLFVGINLMAKDLDKKTIYMVLSKPISRTEYILGKFFGIALILVLTVLSISLFAALSLFILKMGYESFFLRFSWPLVFLGIFFIVMSLSALSAEFSVRVVFVDILYHPGAYYPFLLYRPVIERYQGAS
jgi:ABC-type transport system involved in multi-copper enzyme maturation permease subunit